MKKVLGVIMAAVVAVALTGCSGLDGEPATRAAATAPRADNVRNGDASAKGVIYGIYKAGDQIRFIDEGEVAGKVVEQHGDELIYVDTKTNPERYLKAIDNMTANQTKGTVTCIPDQTMSQVVIDKRRKAGAPVVACDGTLQNNAGNKLVPWVGTNAYVIGQASGNWPVVYAKDNNLVENEQRGLLLLTMDTVFSCASRAEGEYDSFAVNCPGFSAEHIFRADYNGTTNKGDAAATSVITAHPEIGKWLITGVNEEGTIGAVQTPKSAGLDGDARVVGLGVHMAKDEWNGRGVEGTYMKIATYFSSDSVGKGSVKVLYEVIGGREVPLETTVDAVVVTPKSYREVMEKAAK